MAIPVLGTIPFRQLVKIYRGSLFVNQRLCFVGKLNNGTQVASRRGELWHATSVDTDGVLKIDTESTYYNLTDGN